MQGHQQEVAATDGLSRVRSPLRVVYLVSLFPCWSETFIVREIQALVQQGVDVRIFSLKHASEKVVHPRAQQLQALVEYAPRMPVALLYVARELLASPRSQGRVLVRIVRSFIASPVVLAKSLVAWWRVLAVTRKLEGLAPDLLHAHWATYPSTAAWVLAETLGIPFSFTCHAHDIFVEDQMLREKLLGASFVATISEFNREHLRTKFGAKAASNVHVIRCGVLRGEVEYEPMGRDPDYVLSVARLEEIKGLEYLVDACRRLRDQGIRVRCDIVGGGGRRQLIETLIRRHGLGGVVRLRGVMTQQDIHQLLRRATVFALPCVVAPSGDRDGIPVVLMEAMAAGLPVITTRVSGIPELVEDGVNGVLVPARDAAALSTAIRHLMADSDLRLRLAAQGLYTIHQRFNSNIEAERLRHCLEGALQRRVLGHPDPQRAREG